MSSRIVNEWWGLTGAGLKAFFWGMAAGVALCLYASHDDKPIPQADTAVSDAPVSAEGRQFLNAWCAKNYRGNNNVR
ncbi:hypothetical protein VSS37_13470 [Candidatus Thiothrix sp. Deng01]|uniref:Entry exclusion protein TrbK n=1 Tax=Candidatus Thiothrix phosphatis TaxID=3112415 RepID=A0ABU6D0W5_9GAMM|nr:hypothetical protein [Candidatus Thiothrix sp. Deng01]MEB4591997.1 hypothetical protein [Candidatus Thiothrix sp. Deng01]